MSEHSNISSLSSSWQPDVNNDDDDEHGLEIEKGLSTKSGLGLINNCDFSPVMNNR